MSTHDGQWEVWNPFGVKLDNRGPQEKEDQERLGCWFRYIELNVGDPRYFDYLTWQKTAIRREANEEERRRESQSRSR